MLDNHYLNKRAEAAMNILLLAYSSLYPHPFNKRMMSAEVAWMRFVCENFAEPLDSVPALV
jgi:hypothetical protein